MKRKLISKQLTKTITKNHVYYETILTWNQYRKMYEIWIDIEDGDQHYIGSYHTKDKDLINRITDKHIVKILAETINQQS